MKKILKIILIILPAFFITQCGKDEEEKSLNPLKKFDIDVPEPSGLDFNYDKTGLWTVSDKNNNVYLLDLQGNVKESFDTGGTDLEAIASVGPDKVAVVTEADREIILMTNKGKKLGKYSVPVSGDSDSGLEGLAYDSVKKQYYTANEKSPRLIIKLDSAFAEINRYDISFANDLSGLYIDAGYLWVLSDESKSITKCNLNCEPLKSWKIDADQPEGIAVDNLAELAYIVSDSKSKLYIFKLP